MKALKSTQQLTGLREQRLTHREAIELLEIEPQPPIEGAEGSRLDAQDSVELCAAPIADHAAIRHVKANRTATRRSRTTAHTTQELRAQPEGIERAEFDQRAQPQIRIALGDHPQGPERKRKQSPRVGVGAALGSQSIEEFEQITTQREARGIASQRDEGVDQTRLVQSRERGRPPDVHLDLEVAEQIQRPLESTHASTGSLGDYGESSDLWHQ